MRKMLVTLLAAFLGCTSSIATISCGQNMNQQVNKKINLEDAFVKKVIIVSKGLSEDEVLPRIFAANQTIIDPKSNLNADFSLFPDSVLLSAKSNSKVYFGSITIQLKYQN